MRVNSSALASIVFFEAVASLSSFTPSTAKLGATEGPIGHPVCSTIALTLLARAKRTSAPPEAVQSKNFARESHQRGGVGRSRISRVKRPSIQALGRRSHDQGKPAAIRKGCDLGQAVDSARFALLQGTGTDARDWALYLMALPSHDPPRDSENRMPAGPETDSRPSKYKCLTA